MIAIADTDIQVELNGEPLIFDTEPTIVNGRTMVPLKVIFEALGMSVQWDGDLRRVTATKEGLSIELVIGSLAPMVNGEVVLIDVASYIENGRTMVPLRFIAESTGAEVSWLASSRTVAIRWNQRNYRIVDTGQTQRFSNSIVLTHQNTYRGQDADYSGYQPSYFDQGNGVIVDHVTDLMWQKTMTDKMTYDEAVEYAQTLDLGGYDDWRIPTIKELFSLIDYNGQSGGEVASVLYIDTNYFDQPIGDTSIGEREIDAQVWSSTVYVSTTMHADETRFGVNFIDGRIKGYGVFNPRTRNDNKMYFRLVRGNARYGENIFVNNHDGTISDLATGLMWQMSDDGQTRNWSDALDYAENLTLAGYDDWRLPNAKELHSLVDYSKSPVTSSSPAIDDLFLLTSFVDEKGDKNWGYYWTGTTHQDGHNIADSAVYVCFGEGIGKMFDEILDVHGAGAVRSDPKTGQISNYPDYFGPQGDERRVFNYVLAVRELSE